MTKLNITRLAIIVSVLIPALIISNATASAASKQRNGTLKVNAIAKKCRFVNPQLNQKDKIKCTYKKSKSDLIVRDVNYAATGSPNSTAKCNGKKLQGAPWGEVNLGKSRKIKCTPGNYSLKLNDGKTYPENGAQSERTIELKSGANNSVLLGSAK